VKILITSQTVEKTVGPAIPSDGYFRRPTGNKPLLYGNWKAPEREIIFISYKTSPSCAA
jgi:hypothetical protein